MKQKKQLIIFILFFLSGFSALIYQVAWQRMLFARMGGDVESVTIIVSVFMAGLGFGALFGGTLSRRFPGKAFQLFGILEILTGIYGAFSLSLMNMLPNGMVLLSAAALFLPPTLMMGATLPLLSAGLSRSTEGADRAVSVLSFFNTLGSAAACLLTVFFFSGPSVYPERFTPRRQLTLLQGLLFWGGSCYGPNKSAASLLFGRSCLSKL